MVGVNLIVKEADEASPTEGDLTMCSTHVEAEALLERLRSRLLGMGFTTGNVTFKHTVYDIFRPPAALFTSVEWLTFATTWVGVESDDEVLKDLLFSLTGLNDPADYLVTRADLSGNDQTAFDALVAELETLGELNEVSRTG